jgi:hypothetical protein
MESKEDTRLMWIACAAIVAFIVGGMGINMLIHKDAPQPSEMNVTADK